MPNELRQRLNAIIAAIGINDGANKGFWRIQPRDDEGQWMEMGGGVLFRFRTGEGNLVVGTARGIYVGPTGKPGRARVLVKEGNEAGLKPGVYDLDSRNLTQIKAVLPQEALDGLEKAQRTDKFGKPVKSVADAQLPTKDELEANATAPTAEDERLARGELTPEEKAAEQDGRKNSPIADLPTGFEAENPDKVKELLRESGVDPDEFDPDAKKPAAETAKSEAPAEPQLKPVTKKWLEDEANNGKQIFYVRNGKARHAWVSSYDGYIYKGMAPADPDEGGEGLGSFEEFLDALDSGAISGIYQGMIPRVDGKPMEGFQVNRLASKQAEERRQARAAAKAAKAPKTEEAPKAEAPAPAQTPAEPQADPIAEIFADVAYNGDTNETLDSLLEKAAARQGNEALLRQVPDAEGEQPRARKRAEALDTGDVLRNNAGEEQTVVDVKFSPNPPVNGQRQIRIQLQKEDGSIVNLDAPRDFEFNVWGPKRRLRQVPAPQRPARQEPAPAPAAEAPAAPEAPATPEPDTTAPTASDAEEFEGATEVTPETMPPANFPPTDRIDDGEDFEIASLTEDQRRILRGRKLTPLMDADGVPAMFLDENNELKPADDPFEIMNVLAEAYPNAKFAADGNSLILHRQKDKDGKIFEARVSNTGKKAVSFSLRWTDPETGEFEELQYKNDAHSISAALGKYDAEYLLDRILGRKPEYETLKFGRGDSPSTRATMEDTLRKRAEVGFMGVKDATNSRRKLVSFVENALRLAQGRNAIYHENGTLHFSELPSLWDGLDAYLEDRSDVNKEDFYHILYSIFGNAPLDEKAHAIYRSAIRGEFNRRYKGRISVDDTRTFHGLVTSASERLRGIYRGTDTKVRSVKYASKDRSRPVEVGMTVEYVNNVGDISIVKVKSLVKGTGARSQAGDIYDFGDYVIVEDSEGNTRKINALKLRIFDPKRQEVPALTRYIPNLQGAELRQRREEMGVISPIPTERIPGEGFVVSAPPSGPVLVDDLTPGDTLPGKDGKPIGEIIAVKPITSKSGKPGYAFLVRKPDGEEVRVNYAQGTELELKKA